MQAWTARRVAWRRARNLRGTPVPRAIARPHPFAVVACVAAMSGAVLIAVHARKLAQAGSALEAPANADLLYAAVPGALFEVPSESGVAFLPVKGGAIVAASGMQASPAVHVDLCTRPLPLRIGYPFDDVAQAGGALRNVVLARPDAPMPRVLVRTRGNSLHVSWEGGQAQWQADSLEKDSMRREGWLAWSREAALRIERRASAACPAMGELVLQIYRSGGTGGLAAVTAYGATGETRSAWLRAGTYSVPATVHGSLEDQALFEQLRAHDLVRLAANGLAELAPRDLAAWRAAPASARAVDLARWDGAATDAESLKLIKRLYHAADGDYVREQVDVFNGEQRLLAWRAKPGVDLQAQAQTAGVEVAVSQSMPAGAARLFAELPQGWAPWSRVAAWPATTTGGATIALAAPRAGQSLQLMVAGRVTSIEGAHLRGERLDACTGRACPSRDAVQVLTLEPEQGARTISFSAVPLDLAALARPGDQRYRHLRVADGQLQWQPLAPAPLPVTALAASAVTLADRNGAALWSGGAPTPAAAAAGLGTMLGIHANHASSIAGMLARLPSASGLHSARLTIDLALQAASQAALECIGMRRGQWDGVHCSGGREVPAGRQAGLVVVDTETGDILAAAGAGGPVVTAANWNEVRDFDRANPARSPLRLPALQHDGGAHRSPGSTFKVVSALGLEEAARTDPQLDALLAGAPLASINRMASRMGFAFRTDASTYPVGTRLAHITNFRDQHLDRRAQDGKLGLAQAMTYSLNTWFAWSGELSDKTLFGRPDGGLPDLQELESGAIDSARPIAAMAHRLGFGRALRLDGGLLGPAYPWREWDALQASAARIDPIGSRHELRQMSIGLRMQATPLQMALVSAAVGEGHVVVPRLLRELDGRSAANTAGERLGVRLDRIRAGMKGVIDTGTGAGAFRRYEALRKGLSGKTGTAPTGDGDLATVWFTGWLEPGSLPGQPHRLAVATFVSHSEATGGEHAAPVAAAVLLALGRNGEMRGK
jgi:hypothetical protein